jgi:ATP-dependent Zn protease
MSPETAQRIDAAVQGLLRAAQDRATAILEANRATLDRCAEELLAHETLDEAALRALTTGLKAPAVEAPGADAAGVERPAIEPAPGIRQVA